MVLGGSVGPSVGDTWEAALKLYSIRFLARLDFFLFFSDFSEILQYAKGYLLLRDHSKTAHQGLTRVKGQSNGDLLSYKITNLLTDLKCEQHWITSI